MFLWYGSPAKDIWPYFQPGPLSETLTIEPAQNLSSGLAKWSCAVAITTTPQHQKRTIKIWESIIVVMCFILILFDTFSIPKTNLRIFTQISTCHHADIYGHNFDVKTLAMVFYPMMLSEPANHILFNTTSTSVFIRAILNSLLIIKSLQIIAQKFLIVPMAQQELKRATFCEVSRLLPQTPCFKRHNFLTSKKPEAMQVSQG